VDDARQERRWTRILAVGVGGQGVVTAARIIAETAIGRGIPAIMNEIHGMSQRGGVVECSLVLGPGASSPMIRARDADLLLALEPLEALRAAPRHASPDGRVVVYLAENPPPAVSLGGPPMPAVEDILRTLCGLAREVWTLAPEPAFVSGHPLRPNLALIGAATRTGALPFDLAAVVACLPQVVQPRFVESNIASLRWGYETARCITPNREV